MDKIRRILLILVMLAVGVMPTIAFPQSVAAASTDPFTMLDPYVTITPVTTGSWVDVDVSANVPSGATGAIIRWTNDTANKTFGMRKNGSSDTDTFTITGGTYDAMDYMIVGVDANRVFEVYIDDTTTFVLKLVGYTGEGVTMFTNPYDVGPTALAAWQTIDNSAYAPAGTVGFIYRVSSGFGSLRHPDSTDDRQIRYIHMGMAIVGTNAAREQDVYNQSGGDAGTTLQLMGYIDSSRVVFNTNATSIAAASAAAWVGASIADVDIAFIEVYNLGPSVQNWGIRPWGMADTDVGAGYWHGWGVVDVVDNYIQQYTSGTSLDTYVSGYVLPAGNQTETFYSYSGTGDAYFDFPSNSNPWSTCTDSETPRINTGFNNTIVMGWYNSTVIVNYWNSYWTIVSFNYTGLPVGAVITGVKVRAYVQQKRSTYAWTQQYAVYTGNPANEISLVQGDGNNWWSGWTTERYSDIIDYDDATVGDFLDFTIADLVGGDWDYITTDADGYVPFYFQDTNRAAKSAPTDSGRAGNYKDIQLTTPQLIVSYFIPAGPLVDTNAATNVAATSARVNGEVTDVNDTEVTKHAFVWGTTTQLPPGDVDPSATTYDSYSIDTGSWGIGTFYLDLSSLDESETYYFRAAAYNDNLHWTYGDELSFTTGTGIVEITTSAATNVEETTATLNGEVTDYNGATGTERGFVWGTTTQADPGNVHPSTSAYDIYWTEVGSFTAETFDVGVTALTRGELYYFRAAAIGSSAWVYGSELTFLTKPDEPYNLSATVTAPGTIHLTWSKGTGAQNTYIRGKIGSFPANIADGSLVYNNNGTSTDHSGLTGGDEWYYRAWSYATEGALEQYSDAYDSDTVSAVTGPTVDTATTDLHDIGLTTATYNGEVTAIGGDGLTIDYRGFVWDTITRADPGNLSPDATDYNDYYASAGSYGIGIFDYGTTALVASTTYYVRATARNSVGWWSYGDEVTVLTWTAVMHFEPGNRVDSSTLPDLAGTAQDGTITWGTNPAGVTVATPESLVPTGSGAEVIQPGSPDAVGDTTGESLTEEAGDVPTDWPFYPLMSWMAESLEVDIGVWYIIVFFLVGMLAGAAAFIMFRGSFATAYIVAAGVNAVTCWMAVDIGLFEPWIMILYVMLAVPFAFLLLRRGDIV